MDAQKGAVRALAFAELGGVGQPGGRARGGLLRLLSLFLAFDFSGDLVALELVEPDTGQRYEATIRVGLEVSFDLGRILAVSHALPEHQFRRFGLGSMRKCGRCHDRKPDDQRRPGDRSAPVGL